VENSSKRWSNSLRGRTERAEDGQINQRRGGKKKAQNSRKGKKKRKKVNVVVPMARKYRGGQLQTEPIFKEWEGLGLKKVQKVENPRGETFTVGQPPEFSD